MRVCAAKNVVGDCRSERDAASMNLVLALVQAGRQRHVMRLAAQVNLFN